MKTPTNVYLINLAIADIATLVIGISTQSVSISYGLGYALGKDYI